ncbi:anaerobic ribonucleoside-triphosphate reductase activating protein [uncultured Sutterella sp.]|mgnify:CR=1 FL=1|uniref:anaerobic ribonucleoside-triphosphate reductase activating protein n=1 Tax=uncultured Sutterella sp. TaxID=286133 RepID=UPI0025CEB919|nr:anaerobic ribonucleoside-triphosphate reductase activating protein [uncultured Sutterella sp.]
MIEIQPREGSIPPGDSKAPVIPAARLRVAGITPFTTIDFPGKLSAVAFLQGCPWRCIYCQNPWMQPADFDPAYEHDSWEKLEALLRRRRGLLDAVVFSGGEPTADPALPAAMRAVRDMGFAVGLHTAGILPHRLADVLPLTDWVGLDVKAPPEDAVLYERVAGRRHAAAHFLESFRLIRESGVALECRTTAHPDWLSDEKLLEVGRWLEDRGVETFALQIHRNPPGELIARFPAVGADYPAPETMDWFRAHFAHFIERRNDR